ncbi:MAG: NrfD/PsrC family molybdoenzyme membrane anchor subunit [Dehalococcoidia bacterium]|nr:NrfD/PsrC family molybdoenzyme membrane anchor subunit [Dehalococcoidia bacterium]
MDKLVRRYEHEGLEKAGSSLSDRARLLGYRDRLERVALAPLARTGKGFYLVVAVLGAIVLWGLYAYSRQLSGGLAVTGMGNPDAKSKVVWGFYIINFVFFIGISHAGTLISAILRVTNARWRMPVTRMAEFITVVALIVGASAVIIDMGRPDRVLNMILYGRLQSPLIWDFLAISTYLTGSIIYLFVPLLPDLAMVRDRLGNRLSGPRRALYRIISVNWQGLPHQWRKLGFALTIMMIVIIPVAVSVHTVVSWIFAMTLRPGWNSTVFGPYFVAGAIFSGTATLIIMMVILRKVYHLEEFLTKRHFINLGYILAAFCIIMLYFNLQETLVPAYKMAEEEPRWFYDVMGGRYSFWYWSYIFGGMVVPALLILIPRTRNVAGIVVASILVVIAMWLERYLIVVGTLTIPQTPYEQVSYSPTWVEWSIMAGLFALFSLIVAVFTKLVPVVSVWEMVEQHEEAVVHAPAQAVSGDGHAPTAARQRSVVTAAERISR